MEQRHDRQPVADERVVRVVPLRALGVHPDAAAGDEVGELGQRTDEQLLEQRHDDEVAVGTAHQLAVCADLLELSLAAAVRRLVEGDRRLRVAYEVGVVADPVRHVGVHEDPAVEHARHLAGEEALGGLEQPEEVHELVIAPVPDVAPRVLRVRHLPVDPVARDPVGVVPVGGRRVDEQRHHAGEVLGERDAHRLPVLEHVAPVALEADHGLAVVVLHPHREVVPRSARVAVASREAERQVLRARSSRGGRRRARRRARAARRVAAVPATPPTSRRDARRRRGCGGPRNGRSRLAPGGSHRGGHRRASRCR